MGSIVSAYVYTVKDIAGTPRTEGWFLYEFRDQYNPNGEIIDLTPYYRHVEDLQAEPRSGAVEFAVRPNQTDFPVTGPGVGSGRLQLFGLGSNAFNVFLSGVPISIASGTAGLLSGQLLSGNISGQVFFIPFSGRITGEATFGMAALSGNMFTEILSGKQTSGARARVHAIGY